MTIGEKIKALRKEKHITQEALGNHLKVTYQAVSKWETNDTMPDITLLPQIADYFHISIDMLFGRELLRHCKGYANERQRFMTIYETNGGEEHFHNAVSIYNEIMLHGKATEQDYVDYAYLFDLRSKKDFDTALKYYNLAIEKGAEGRSMAWLQSYQQRTMLYIRHNLAAENLKMLYAWRDKESDKIEPYIALAFAHYKTGEHEMAFELIQRAEKFNSNHVTQLTIAGDICCALEKYSEAIAYFDRAYAADSGCAAALYSKAFLYEKTGEILKAIQAWKMIIEWHKREGFDLGPELQIPEERLYRLEQQI